MKREKKNNTWVLVPQPIYTHVYFSGNLMVDKTILKMHRHSSSYLFHSCYPKGSPNRVLMITNHD